MEWSKIKNIIILILLCVNLFLLALVGLREGKAARYQDEARASAVAVLETNNIVFGPERVPKDMALETLALTRNRDGEQAMAEALLGAVEKQDESGGVRVTYRSEAGSAEFFSSGGFRFDLALGARRLDGETPQRDAAACLSLLGLHGTLLTSETGEGGTTLTYRQDWDGTPVFSCEVALTYRDGALRKIEGQQLTGTTTAVAGAEPLSTATVLVRFLAGINKGGYVCSKIDDMTAGYVASGARPVKLSPVWLVTTDTGAYYVDGVTGDLSVAE